MDEQSGFLNKIKRIFRRQPDIHSDLPLLQGDQPPAPADDPTGNGQRTLAPTTSRVSIFRPWARRDAAISNLQSGFVQLNGLMGAIKDHLEAQGQRHDQLISHLSHLPKVMDLIPETSRVQSETLKAIHQQLEQQNISQRQLANILERISQTGGDQRKILDSLRERMDMLNEHDQVIADNLTGFGAAMQSVSRNSQTSAQVLEQLRDNMARRDDQIETILKSYNSRFIILLSVVSFFAIGAFLSVIYLLWNRPVDERFITPRMPTPITTSPTTQGG
jgi:hypothetical protein